MKKGFVLITVLAVVIVMALGIATVLKSVGSQTDMKSNNLQEVQSQYLAEAGMQFGLWRARNQVPPESSAHDIDGRTANVDLDHLPTITVTVDYVDV